MFIFKDKRQEAVLTSAAPTVCYGLGIRSSTAIHIVAWRCPFALRVARFHMLHCCLWKLQVAKLPLRTLEARFGKRATWIHDAVRGISDDPVQVHSMPP